MQKTTSKGFKRFINAAKFSSQGIKSAYKYEEAFRQEVFALMLVIPAAIYFADNFSDSLFLISSFLLVLLVELINSAIEATVDRFGGEQHELSGRAKDMGSAAVSLSIIICIAVWGGVLFKG